MTSVEFDFSELNKLSVTLDEAPTKVRRNARKAVERTAFLGKKVWAAEARSKAGVHLPGYPAAIDYDVEGIGAGNRSGEITAEVGPSLGRGQGALGIVEDAPGGVRAAPQRNYVVAEREMQEDLVRGILAAVEDGLGGQ